MPYELAAIVLLAACLLFVAFGLWFQTTRAGKEFARLCGRVRLALARFFKAWRRLNRWFEERGLGG